MSDLIKRDALIADLDKGLWGKDYDKALAEAIIQDAPTIDIEERLNEAYAHGWSDAEAKYHDAVEVVRCKHCRRWLNGDDTYGTCQWNEYQTLQTRYDDYCSYGERK